MLSKRSLLLAPCLVVVMVACSSSGSSDDPSTTTGEDAGTSNDDGHSDGGGGGTSDGGAVRCATPPCSNGEQCISNGDCQSDVCKGGTCIATSGNDGTKNGDETDIDCGGDPAGAARCADGKTCLADGDCEHTFCKAGICATPTHDDGVKNAGETDVDCGGTTGAPACNDLLACGVAADCKSQVCTGAVCQVPTHDDKVKNGDETGVDCGGPTANKCDVGGGCDDANGARDCTSLVCKGSVCQAPSHDDKVKNGDETGVDCGGPTSGKRCADGDGCDVANAARDCESLVCKNSVCQAPSDSDGVKNGKETDLDCGGPNAKACKPTDDCLVDTDCSTKACGPSKTCAWGRSCGMHHGGDTCGVGDETYTQDTNATFTSGTKDHHDCCESAVVDPNGVPNSGDEFRLDKYQITAGRMRRFIESVNGNVRKWVQDARNKQNGESFADPGAAAQLPAGNDIYLPMGMLTNETVTTPAPPDGSFAVMQATSSVNAVAHLGGYRYTTEPGGGGGYGCTIDDGDYGARTYRLEDGAQVSFYGEKQHSVSKDRLDQKVLTCVDYYMLAAFCAWDGGRLETVVEHDKAWGNGTFPWGNTGATQGFQYAIGDLRYGGNAGNAADLIYNATPGAPGNFIKANLERTNAAWNYANYFIRDTRRYLEGRGVPREYPGEMGALLGTTSDQSYAVAPPGRYPSGAGPWGHQDLLGNAMEITATIQTVNGKTAYRWSKNGSFESYTHWSGVIGYDGFRFGGLTKYGRATGRCARPVSIP